MKSPTIQPGEALLLSLTVAIQQERAATSALDQADADRAARLNDLYIAKNSVAEAGKAIHQFATSTQITTVEVNPDREAFYGQAVKSGVMPALTPPAIGEYWVGQGGIYGGPREYPEGLCYTIFAAEDVGKYAWGPHNTDTDATSKTDGRDNDIPRSGSGEVLPAFTAADSYTADGHLDFYLPSIGELSHAWQFIPDSFAKEAYWSSSQRSAYFAFYMDFDDGDQSYYCKTSELRVRPVRRFLR